MTLLSHGERKGPAPQAWEGEGVRSLRRNPSPSHRFALGPSLSLWERKRKWRAYD
jgi:hypothetical protein